VNTSERKKENEQPFDIIQNSEIVWLMFVIYLWISKNSFHTNDNMENISWFKYTWDFVNVWNIDIQNKTSLTMSFESAGKNDKLLPTCIFIISTEETKSEK